jgi:hypothetical protein
MLQSQSQRSRSGRLNANAVASVERALKTVSADNLSDGEIKSLLARPRIDFTSILNTVSRSCWTAHQPAAAGAGAAATRAAKAVAETFLLWQQHGLTSTT